VIGVEPDVRRHRQNPAVVGLALKKKGNEQAAPHSPEEAGRQDAAVEVMHL